MEFRIQRKGSENKHRYPTGDLAIARKFTEEVKKELGDFLIGSVIFGSFARGSANKKSDIDVLLITNDASFVISEPLVEGYRIIVESLITKISLKLHITSMTFTGFWEQVKNGDPVVMNILRDGFPLLDNGFFDPLQKLLRAGHMKPSEESVWRYFGRAPRTLLNSRWHVLQATLDLYWAVIDSAHAALMRKGELPPTPGHVAEMLEKVYVKPKLLEKKYADSMKRFYKLNKMITHREVKEISGKDYEMYHKEASDFVKRMKKLISKKV